MASKRGGWTDAVKPQEKAVTRQENIAMLLAPDWLRFRSPLLADLNRHAIALARAHLLTVVVGRPFSAWVQTRTVRVLPVASEETYAAFLHECAHVVDPDSCGYQFRNTPIAGTLNSPLAEAGAWRWAVRSALTWTRAMHEDLVVSLVTYASFATNDDERAAMKVVIAESALHISDRPVTFAELDTQTARIGCER